VSKRKKSLFVNSLPFIKNEMSSNFSSGLNKNL